LKSGAAIDEMNCVRKHLSAIKGGRLAARCAPAQVVTLLISDVPGDAPEVIGSCRLPRVPVSKAARSKPRSSVTRALPATRST
jgi:glycerate-2-kinase